MTPDELKLRFELVRQSIAGWTADTAHFVGAASEVRQTGTPNHDDLAAAERTLRSVVAEREAFTASVDEAEVVDDDLARGVEVALNELSLLERDLGSAVEAMSAAK